MKKWNNGMIWSLRAAAAALFLLSFDGTADHASQSLRFPSLECSAGTMDPLQIAVFPFPVQNCTMHPVRVLGAAGICRAPGCVSVTDLPLTIPPLSTRPIAIEVYAGRQEGPFHLETTLFTDCAGQSEFGIGVSGCVKRK
jgi:hypothetical protein